MIARQKASAPWIAGVVVAAALVLAGRAQDPPSSTALSTKGQFHPLLADDVLQDEHGATRHLTSDVLAGKTVVVQFMFTTCRLSCPQSTARLKRLYNELASRMGQDVAFVSITIDPEHDDSAVLDAFKKSEAIGAGWTFLTASPGVTTRVQDQLTRALPRDATVSLGHGDVFIIGQADAGLWYRRSQKEPTRDLAAFIRQLADRRRRTT